MTTQITQKTKQKEEATPRGEALAPYREFPFFLSRMRDEFDRLLDRFTSRWPSLWGGTGDDCPLESTRTRSRPGITTAC
jgi:hypothetical protein